MSCNNIPDVPSLSVGPLGSPRAPSPPPRSTPARAMSSACTLSSLVDSSRGSVREASVER